MARLVVELFETLSLTLFINLIDFVGEILDTFSLEIKVVPVSRVCERMSDLKIDVIKNVNNKKCAP